MFTILAQGLQNPIAANSALEVFDAFLDGVTVIALPIFVLIIIWIGAQFVFARGEPQKLAELKLWLTWSLVGLFIVLSSQAILYVVVDTADKVGVDTRR